MVMTSPTDETESLTLESIVLGIVEEHLNRNGGACLLSVKTVLSTICKRRDIEESKALVVDIDKILDGLPESQFFDNISDSTRKYVNGKCVKVPGKKARLYELRRAA
jgi:hypothetical protein